MQITCNPNRGPATASFSSAASSPPDSPVACHGTTTTLGRSAGIGARAPLLAAMSSRSTCSANDVNRLSRSAGVQDPGNSSGSPGPG